MADENPTSDGIAPEGTGAPGGNESPSKPITFSQEQVDALVDTAVQKSSQDVKTWLGRRDKALIDQIAGTIDERLSTFKPHTGDGIAPADFDFENPAASIDKIVTLREQKKQSEAQKFNDAALAGMGRYMDSDPMFKDQEFGKQVIEGAIQNIGRLRRDVPPDVAGQLLIKDTILSLSREKISGRNPLDKNTGPKPLFGSEGPPGGGPKKSVTPPKLSAEAQKLAERFGYDTEALIKLFPDT